MYPLYDTFHRLTISESPKLLYARLFPDELQLLKDDKAFIGRPSDKKVCGTCGPISDSLLSILLTSPLTKARLEARASSTGPSANNEGRNAILYLEHTDTHSLTLQLSLPVLPTPAPPILADLHSSLLTAVAALEGVLLASNSYDDNAHISTDAMGSQHGAMSLTTLTTLHAPSKPTGEVLSKISSFRSVAAADDTLIAARGFAVATQAAAVRKDIILRRQTRLEEERRRHKYERRVAHEAVHRGTHVSVASTGAAALFDNSSSEGSPDPVIPVGQPSNAGNNPAESNTAHEHETVQSYNDGRGEYSGTQREEGKNLVTPDIRDGGDSVTKEKNDQYNYSAGERPERGADGDVEVGLQNNVTIKSQDDLDSKPSKPRKKKRKVTRLV